VGYTRNVRSGLTSFKVPSWKLRNFNDEIAYERMIYCTNHLELMNIGEHLYKDRYKGKNKISKM
jgi:hypothetical protein